MCDVPRVELNGDGLLLFNMLLAPECVTEDASHRLVGAIKATVVECGGECGEGRVDVDKRADSTVMLSVQMHAAGLRSFVARRPSFAHAVCNRFNGGLS